MDGRHRSAKLLAFTARWMFSVGPVGVSIAVGVSVVV